MKLLSVLVAVAVCAACVPARLTFFRPSAEGGQLTKSSCGGAAGPEDRLILANDNGAMTAVEAYSLRELDTIHGEKSPRHGTGVSIILHIPLGDP